MIHSPRVPKRIGLVLGRLGGACASPTGVSQSLWPSLGAGWACVSLLVLVGWKREFWRLSRTSLNLPWEALSRAERGSESGPVWTRLRLVQNSLFHPTVLMPLVGLARVVRPRVPDGPVGPTGSRVGDSVLAVNQRSYDIPWGAEFNRRELTIRNMVIAHWPIGDAYRLTRLGYRQMT